MLAREMEKKRENLWAASFLDKENENFDSTDVEKSEESQAGTAEITYTVKLL